MVEPFGAAGLALAALALPAQVFSSCVQAYNTVSDVKSTGRQLDTLSSLGTNSDIYSDGVSPERLSQPVYEMIISTLMQIKDLLQDVDKLRNYYGLQQVPEPNWANRTEQAVAQREIRRQATLVFQVQKSCSLFQRLKWAVHDSDRFAGLVQQLMQFNDALYEFSPLMQRSSQTAAVDAEALALLAIANQGWQGVQALQQAVAFNQQPPNTQSSAGNGGSSRSYRQIPSRSSAYMGGLHVLQAETGPNPPIQHFSPALDLFYNFNQFEFHPLPNDTPHRRTWAQFGGSAAPTQVVLEWRRFDHMGRPSINALQLRVEALARMLRKGTKPPGFRILDCLGYVEDPSNPRFAIIFRYPQQSTQSRTPHAPISLFQILNHQTYPYLGDKFRLASFLAESLYELHASRWLHKSVSSHNILFFHHPHPTQASSLSAALSHPFLSGFALARPDDPGAVSDLNFPDTEDGIYQHPEVQGLQGTPKTRFHNIHDIYSLGTVLLEIGTWVPLKRLYKERTNGPGFRTRLLNEKISLLGVTMGEKYMNAVRKCLSGEFDGMRQFPDSERYTEDFVINLHRSYYWEVVKTLKECHV